jgi:hypothetical protein
MENTTCPKKRGYYKGQKTTIRGKIWTEVWRIKADRVCEKRMTHVKQRKKFVIGDQS